MIVRREKVRKELHRTSMEVFYKQNDMLLDENEDWSGEKLDFLRHRSTQFTEFSDSYVTEKVWKEQNGRTTTFFDTTLEEELLNSSQFEMLDEKDLHREADSSNSTSRASSPKINGIVKNPNSGSTQRNIFDFFRRETKPIENIIKTEKDDEKKAAKLCDASTTTVKKLEFGEGKILDREKELVDLMTDDEDSFEEKGGGGGCKKEVEEDTEVTFKSMIKTQEPTNIFENIEQIVEGRQEEDCVKENGIDQCSSKKPLSNHLEDEKYENESNNDDVFKPSSLVRKGKKRFRNLAPLDERRNSPRLHKVTDDVLDNQTTNHKLKPLVNGSKKRRRLNSCGDFIGENGDEQPDYVRMTRSRVSSCT